MPGYYEIAFCESTAPGQQQDTASQMFRVQTLQYLEALANCHIARAR